MSKKKDVKIPGAAWVEVHGAKIEVELRASARCSTCNGKGLLKTPEWIAYEYADREGVECPQFVNMSADNIQKERGCKACRGTGRMESSIMVGIEESTGYLKVIRG